MGDATATPPPVPATAKSKTPPSKKSKMDNGSKVKVVVRVRPLLHSEIMRHASFTLRHSVERNQISMGNGKGLHEYTYDGVLPDEMMQKTVFERATGGMIDSLFHGYNQTILAYGQTGSGKTYTMGTAADKHDVDRPINDTSGIVPRFISAVCDRKPKLLERNKIMKMKVSFLEVYNEELKDLLAPRAHNVLAKKSSMLKIVDGDKPGSVRVKNLHEVKVGSFTEVMQHLAIGTERRTTASTHMNEVSSRSHAVFVVTIEQHPKPKENVEASAASNDDSVVIISKVTFVDLAGSERLKRTHATGTRMAEGININKGLLVLGKVINALGDEEILRSGKQVHVPYREAKLTRLLQEGLGGNSRTLFIACVSPADDNCNETLNTLRYANRARNITNVAVLNIDPKTQRIQRLFRERNAWLKAAVMLRFGNKMLTAERARGFAELLKLAEVQQYIANVSREAQEQDLSSQSSKALARAVEAAKGKNVLEDTQELPPHTSGGTMALGTPKRSSTPQDQTSMAMITKMQNIIESNSPRALASQVTAIPRSVKAVDDVDGPAGDGQEVDEDTGDSREILQNQLILERRECNFQEDSEQKDAKVHEISTQITGKEKMLAVLKESVAHYKELQDRYNKECQRTIEIEKERDMLSQQIAADSLTATPSKKQQLVDRHKRLVLALQEMKDKQRSQLRAMKHAQKAQARAGKLEESIRKLKQDKARIVRAKKDDSKRHREWMKSKEREIRKMRRAQMKQQKVLSDQQSQSRRQTTQLRRRTMHLKSALQRQKDTEKQLLSLLRHKKRSLMKKRGRAARKSRSKGSAPESPRSPTTTPKTEVEELAAADARLTLLQREIIRRATIDQKNYELETHLVKREVGLEKLQAAIVKRASLIKSRTPDNADDLQGQIQELEDLIENLEMQYTVVESVIKETKSEIRMLRLAVNVSETYKKRVADIHRSESKKDGDEHSKLDPDTLEDQAKMMQLLDGITTGEAQHIVDALVDLTVQLQFSCAIANLKIQQAESVRDEAESRLETEAARMAAMKLDFEQSKLEICSSYEDELLAFVRAAGDGGKLTLQAPGGKPSSNAEAPRLEVAFELLRKSNKDLEDREKASVDRCKEANAKKQEALQKLSDAHTTIAKLQREIENLKLSSSLSSGAASVRGSVMTDTGSFKSRESLSLLRQVWDDLGVSAAQQLCEIEELNTTLQSRFDQKRKELEVDRHAMRDKQKRLGARVAAAKRILQITSTEDAGGENEVLETPLPLADQVDLVRQELERLTKNIQERLEEQHELGRRARELVHELGMKQSKQSPALRELLVRTERDIAIKDLGDGALASARLSRYEGVVRALSVARSEIMCRIRERAAKARNSMNELGLTYEHAIPMLTRWNIAMSNGQIENQAEEDASIRAVCEYVGQHRKECKLSSKAPQHLLGLVAALDSVKRARKPHIDNLFNATVDVMQALNTTKAFEEHCENSVALEKANTNDEQTRKYVEEQRQKQQAERKKELAEHCEELRVRLDEAGVPDLSTQIIDILINGLKRLEQIAQVRLDEEKKALINQWQNKENRTAADSNPQANRAEYESFFAREEKLVRRLAKAAATRVMGRSKTNYIKINSLEKFERPLPDLVLLYSNALLRKRYAKEINRIHRCKEMREKIQEKLERISDAELEMDVFQKKSTSKDRLKGSSIQLVKEDQYRKKMKKNYPKLLTSLSDMVKRYEVDFQETFLVDGQPLLPQLTSVIEAKAGTRLSLMHIELGAERVHNANKRTPAKAPAEVSTPTGTRGRSRTFGSGRDRTRKHNTPTRKGRKHGEKVLHEKQQSATKSISKSKTKRRK